MTTIHYSFSKEQIEELKQREDIDLLDNDSKRKYMNRLVNDDCKIVVKK